jgi:hypothetical protein
LEGLVVALTSRRIHVKTQQFKRPLLYVSLAAALAGGACAQDASSPPSQTAAQPPAATRPASDFAELEQEYRAAVRAFVRAHNAAQAAATRAATATRPSATSPADAAASDPPAEAEPEWSKHPVHTYRPKFRALAEKYAGRPEAIPPLAWLVDAPSLTPEHAGLPDAEWALGLLTRAHAADPEVEPALWSAALVGVRRLAEPADAFFARVLATNPDRQAQASARLAAATVLLERNNLVSIAGPQREQNRLKAVELLHAIGERYADLDTAKVAEGCLYEAEHLQVGMPAPEIVGTDADGHEIRLSQFRGQVVVLDFWGFW